MDLPEKITNVRRATRLLAAYNRRLMSILTLVHQAAESADKVSLKFVRWAPLHHNPIGKQTTSPFGRWGWDYLPLSYSWFQWTTKGTSTPNGPESVFLGFSHIVDDAYVPAEDGGEPDPSSFSPAEDNKTFIEMWLLAVKSGNTGASWDAISNVVDEAFEEPHHFDGVVKDVPIGALPQTTPGTVVRYVGWKVAIDEIATEQDVEKLVLEPLRQKLGDVFQQT